MNNMSIADKQHDKVEHWLELEYADVRPNLEPARQLLQRLDQVDAGLQAAREAARRGKPVLVNAWLDKTDFREGSLSM